MFQRKNPAVTRDFVIDENETKIAYRLACHGNVEEAIVFLGQLKAEHRQAIFTDADTITDFVKLFPTTGQRKSFVQQASAAESLSSLFSQVQAFNYESSELSHHSIFARLKQEAQKTREESLPSYSPRR